MRCGVLAVDELDDWMIFVRGGPVREIFLTFEAEGLVEPLLDVRIDVMERFMLEVSLTFFDVLVGGNLVGIFCSVFYFLLLFGWLVVTQGWTLLVGHAHHQFFFLFAWGLYLPIWAVFHELILSGQAQVVSRVSVERRISRHELSWILPSPHEIPLRRSRLELQWRFASTLLKTP